MTNMDREVFSDIEYGLYVVTTSDYVKDNGCIVNAVNQVTNLPARIAVSINKNNYTHDVAKATRKMNLNCLSESAPFSIFEKYGFSSGKNVCKFCQGMDVTMPRSSNGLVYLDKYINAYISLEVEQYIDLDTHGLFICKVTEAKKITDEKTMDYTYYHENVKPKAIPVKFDGKKAWRCVICNYIYEGDELPEDYICPLCKHPASDFERIS